MFYKMSKISVVQDSEDVFHIALEFFSFAFANSSLERKIAMQP
jgi:hypothetical protein